MAVIVIDARFYGLEHTGLGRYTTNILHFLPKHLHNHTLKILLRHKYCDTVKLPDNCEIIAAEIPHYSVQEQVALPSLIESQHGDLFYALHFNVPVLVKVPFVVTIHDLIKSHFAGSETTTRSPWIFRLKRWGYSQVVRHAIGASRSIIVPSNTVKNEILAAYDSDPTRIVVIPEAPDQVFRSRDERSTVTDSLPRHFLLYVGNAYPHKNLGVLLRALEKMSEKELVLCVNPTSFLNRVLGSLDVQTKKRITIISRIDDQSLPDLYKRADALITPSLMEGYGLPGIESLAVGTPVIASDIPVYREVYGNHATFFDPMSPDNLVEVIRSLKGGVKKKYDSGRTWDDAARQIAEVLNENCNRL